MKTILGRIFGVAGLLVVLVALTYDSRKEACKEYGELYNLKTHYTRTRECYVKYNSVYRPLESHKEYIRIQSTLTALNGDGQ